MPLGAHARPAAQRTDDGARRAGGRKADRSAPLRTASGHRTVPVADHSAAAIAVSPRPSPKRIIWRPRSSDLRSPHGVATASSAAVAAAAVDGEPMSRGLVVSSGDRIGSRLSGDADDDRNKRNSNYNNNGRRSADYDIRDGAASDNVVPGHLRRRRSSGGASGNGNVGVADATDIGDRSYDESPDAAEAMRGLDSPMVSPRHGRSSDGKEPQRSVEAALPRTPTRSPTSAAHRRISKAPMPSPDTSAAQPSALQHRRADDSPHRTREAATGTPVVGSSPELAPSPAKRPRISPGARRVSAASPTMRRGPSTDPRSSPPPASASATAVSSESHRIPTPTQTVRRARSLSPTNSSNTKPASLASRRARSESALLSVDRVRQRSRLASPTTRLAQYNQSLTTVAEESPQVGRTQTQLSSPSFALAADVPTADGAGNDGADSRHGASAVMGGGRRVSLGPEAPLESSGGPASPTVIDAASMVRARKRHPRRRKRRRIASATAHVAARNAQPARSALLRRTSHRSAASAADSGTTESAMSLQGSGEESGLISTVAAAMHPSENVAAAAAVESADRDAQPKRSRHVRFSRVELRLYPRQHAGGGGVPEEGAFPLGISFVNPDEWNEDNVKHFADIESYEASRQRGRRHQQQGPMKVPEAIRAVLLGVADLRPARKPRRSTSRGSNDDADSTSAERSAEPAEDDTGASPSASATPGRRHRYSISGRTRRSSSDAESASEDLKEDDDTGGDGAASGAKYGRESGRGTGSVRDEGRSRGDGSAAGGEARSPPSGSDSGSGSGSESEDGEQECYEMHFCVPPDGTYLDEALTLDSLREDRSNVGCQCCCLGRASRCDRRACPCFANGVQCHDDICLCPRNRCRNPEPRFIYDDNAIKRARQQTLRRANRENRADDPD